MTTTSTTARPSLVQRISTLKSLPASQAILKPLLDLLRQPLDDIEIPKVVELVSYEKTIAAQLLRIANSPLYARSSTVDSIQNAVFTVGVQRIEDILLTHCFSKLVAPDKWVVDPGVFWRHSFGCALVCKEFATRIGYQDTDKAYLCGLLHDIGIIVNSLVATDDYRQALASAVKWGRPLDEQERDTLGFTHSESGLILARAWQLPPAVIEVIEWHHNPGAAPATNPLIDLTHIGDLLCRVRDLGYGYQEWRAVDLAGDPAWSRLAAHCPKLLTIDLERFTLDLDAYVMQISKFVDEIFSPH
jgi:putative nucleotidyltransferase with HDIG domain